MVWVMIQGVIGSVGILVLHTVLLDLHDMVKLSLISDHGCHIHFIMNVIMTPILVSSGWGVRGGQGGRVVGGVGPQTY